MGVELLGTVRPGRDWRVEMDETIGKRPRHEDVVPCAWASGINLGDATVVQHLASSLTFTGRPQLVGIVNVTTDSFSDGGRFLAAEDAVAHARRLRKAGADIQRFAAAHGAAYLNDIQGFPDPRR